MWKEGINNPIPVPLSNYKNKKKEEYWKTKKQMEAIWSYPLGWLAVLQFFADILKASFPCNLMSKERVTILVENEGLTPCKYMCPIMRNTTARAQLIAQSGICTSWRIIKNLTKILLTYRNGKTFTVGHKYTTPLLLSTLSHCH